ncbi:hypothetical protein WJX74_009999 [Apatococcus lobatus]|uniref:Uncharacterized protein n=1 Tax=Apatococcus lobatus TaxID=904363 RepID=A0AAW1RRB7_9CHLO
MEDSLDFQILNLFESVPGLLPRGTLVRPIVLSSQSRSCCHLPSTATGARSPRGACEPGLERATTNNACKVRKPPSHRRVYESGNMRPPFSQETLKQMLIRENDLRLCPETQAAYAEAELR